MMGKHASKGSQMQYSTWRRLVTSGAVLVMGLGLGMAGCAKAKPAPSAGFVPVERMEHDPALPFHKVWRQPGVNWDQYKRLYVAPVNTAYMLQATEWQQGARRGEIEQDVQKIALYTQDAIKKAFRADEAALASDRVPQYGTRYALPGSGADGGGPE
jgi:hypothetical protein